MNKDTDDGRIERTLARELRHRRVLLPPGAKVRLRPDQIERLEPEGYFEPAPGQRPAAPAKGGER